MIQQDEEVLKVILQNLLSNAYKYTYSGGRVLLKSYVEANLLTILVRDTGRGIPAEDIPYIFDRYFQSSLNHSMVEGGTGIGLSLVKEMVALVGGNISVDSEWGKGATFKVELPLLDVGHMQQESNDNAFIPETDAMELSHADLALVQGRQILLVEDNRDFYKIIDCQLGGQFLLQTAGNGEEALRLLQEGVKPVLIITDLMMPHMDGYQFLAKLSEDKTLSKIPVLVLTARVDESSRMAAFNFGVSDYIIKPFDGQMLLRTVMHLVKRYLVQVQFEMDSTTNEEEVYSWLARVKALVEENLASENFSVDQLANDMLTGRTTFYNQVRKFTGMTPNQLILEARLQRARKILLESPELTIMEVVNAVGLKHGPHFNETFKKRFGHTPSQLRREYF
jgi:DNA-binding response OmpR family regulator